jgi:hypothetical protein
MKLVLLLPTAALWILTIPAQAAVTANFDDLPAPRDFTPMRGKDPTVLLYASEPGTYAVHWTVDGPNWGSGMHDQPTFEVAENGTDQVVERVFPATWAAATTRDMQSRKRR